MDQHWLSNPESFTDLPYPSTTYKPPARFETFRDAKGATRFKYMGREAFKKLYDAVELFLQDPDFGGNSRSTIRLHGLSGIGKSHILAALACLLLQQNEAVVYIPNCETIIRDPIHSFKEIFSLAFPDSQEEISTFTEVKNILDFLQCVDRGSIICIAEQLDALAPKPQDPSPLCESRALANHIIHRISETQLLIFTTSPNPYQLAIEDITGGSEHTKISISGGLTEVCDSYD